MDCIAKWITTSENIPDYQICFKHCGQELEVSHYQYFHQTIVIATYPNARNQ